MNACVLQQSGLSDLWPEEIGHHIKCALLIFIIGSSEADHFSPSDSHIVLVLRYRFERRRRKHALQTSTRILAKVSLSHFPVFFNCTNCAVAKWKSSSSSSSGGGTQGGTVMRMSFFWLAALVFACAGECREQFSQRAFYLLDRPAINLCGICVKTPAAQKRF